MIIQQHLHVSNLRLLNIIFTDILKGTIRLDTQQIYLWDLTWPIMLYCISYIFLPYKGNVLI